MTGPQQPPYGGQGGQWTGGGGEWQAPSDQTQYNTAPSSGGPAGYDQPQAYEQPGYDQPNFGQPHAYEQYQQQPGYPDQYSAPPAGYTSPYSPPPAPPGYPMTPGPVTPVPPVKQSSPVPWIIGGIAGLVVLGLVIVIGAVLLTAGDDGSGGPGVNRTTGADGGDGDGDGLKYSGAKISNACDLIDVASMQKWARNQDKEPQHTENKSDYYSSFSCSAAYKGNEYDTARISMYASVGGPSTDMRNSYDSSEKSAKGQTGTGRETGDVSGIGEDAYYYSFVSDSNYSSSIIYELGTFDSNLMVTVNVSVFLGKAGGVDKEDIRKVCEENAKKVMDGLKA